MTTFYSNGKILLSGEYVVLDGATSLAVPTKYGQSLEARSIDDPAIHWKSFDHEGEIWFEESFRIQKGDFYPVSNASGEELTVARRLQNILQEAYKLNPEVTSINKGFAVTTKLDFPDNWGLGSSSTLINNVAKWFKIDAYQLLKETFGGSGYDIASAQNNQPVAYTLTNNGRTVFTSGFDPAFKDELFFVHLNRKQNSRESISHYKNQPKNKLEEAVEKVTALTHQIIKAKTITEFELLLEIHETAISQIINTPKIKSQLFPDYPRTIKSLGGWGGDFALVTGRDEDKDYFRSKGYKTIVPYSEMVL